ARARDLTVAHAADEEIALPAREAIARVERHARDGDRRHPRDDRVDHAFAMELVGLKRPAVRPAAAHVRPPGGAARDDDVDLVAAVRAHLALENLSRRLVIDQAFGRAVANRINLGTIAFAADERVVTRNSAVVVVAQDLAGQTHRVLRHFARLAPG